MLQVPYKKGFDMPGFKLFLLTVTFRMTAKEKPLGFQSKKNSAIHKGWHAINNFEMKIFFSPIVFTDLPPFFTQKGSHIHPTSGMSRNTSCFRASKLDLHSELGRIATEPHSVLTL